MFKTKAKKRTLRALTGSFMEGRDILSNRVSDGMKYAQNHIVDIAKYMRKNSSLNFVRDRIQKNPANGIITLAGLGLIVFGISRLTKK